MGQTKAPDTISPSPEIRKILTAYIERYRYSILGELLKGIIHNLNGSLQVLSMQMELLQRMLPPEEKMQDQMGKCLGQIDKFKEMLDMLIKKGVHDEQEVPQPIQLNGVLEEQLSLLHHNLFFKHQVRVYKNLTSPLPLLKGYYADFSQILFNLIQNALEAMEDSQPKELTLVTRLVRDQIVLTIQDTGCGIPEEMKPQIFNAFVTNKGKKHQGIGLYFARELLLPYGGSIQYFCQEGKTVFEVLFPLKAEPNRH